MPLSVGVLGFSSGLFRHIWESTGRGTGCCWDSGDGDDLKGGKGVWRAGAEEKQGTGNMMSRSLARGLGEK